jgi:hypothetical protein
MAGIGLSDSEGLAYHVESIDILSEDILAATATAQRHHTELLSSTCKSQPQLNNLPEIETEELLIDNDKEEELGNETDDSNDDDDDISLSLLETLIISPFSTLLRFN